MALTDNDREYLHNLITAQTGELKSDMRWIKRLSGVALTVAGGALTIIYSLHQDVSGLKGKALKYESDHLKCHRWEWRTTNRGEHP